MRLMYKSNHVFTTKNYLIMSVIAFAIGIYFAVALDALVLFGLLVFALFLFFVLLVLVIYKTTVRGKFKHFLLPAFLIFSMLLGMCRVVFTEHIAHNLLKDLENRSAWLSGTVLTQPVESSSGFSYWFEFEVQQINFEDTKPANIIMYVPKSRVSHANLGNQVYCWASVTTPKREDLNDNYDYYTHLRNKNIFFIGDTKNITPTSFNVPFSVTAKIIAAGNIIRQKIILAIDSFGFKNPRLSAILKGILIGDKSDFTDEMYTEFSNAGISHIVAVSGMHLSVLFSVLLIIFYTMRTHRKTALVLAVPVIVLFASASAFTPSVCRSAIMLLMMIVSTLFCQRYSPINSLFLAWGILLMVSPYSLFSKSLTLSFGATLGILVYFKYFFHIFQHFVGYLKTSHTMLNSISKKLLDFIYTSIGISLSAFVGTVYFCIVMFGSISKIQILTNLWAVPLVSAIFPLGYLCCILFYILPVLVPVLKVPLEFFLGLISGTAEFFGKETFAINVPVDSLPWIFFVIYLGIAILLYMILKTIYDINTEKKKAAEKFDRRVKGKSLPD